MPILNTHSYIWPHYFCNSPEKSYLSEDFFSFQNQLWPHSIPDWENNFLVSANASKNASLYRHKKILKLDTEANKLRLLCHLCQRHPSYSIEIFIEFYLLPHKYQSIAGQMSDVSSDTPSSKVNDGEKTVLARRKKGGRGMETLALLIAMDDQIDHI